MKFLTTVALASFAFTATALKLDSEMHLQTANPSAQPSETPSTTPEST